MSLTRSFTLASLLYARLASLRFAKLGGSEGAEILEFAISLPLLLVVVVGVFDFGTAFTVKQKLGNTALQGARVASNQPTADLSLTGGCNAPPSICSVRDVVDKNLVASALNDCGLAAANGAPGAALTWTFTTTGTCSGPLTLTIERGYHYTATLPNPPFSAAAYTIEATRLTLNYPYRWQFNKVAPLVAPGANYPAVSQINSVAIMQKLN